MSLLTQVRHLFRIGLLVAFISKIEAQQTLQGVVLDSVDGTPIPYVNISLRDQPTGTVSDYDGRFVLNPSLEHCDVIFSAIGYETRFIKSTQLKRHSKIKLKAKNYALQTVEVAATRFNGEEMIFGLRNETRGHSIAYGSHQLGSELAAPIEIDRPTLIKSANFVLNHAKGDSLLLRINIYALVDGEIRQNILRENVFIKDKQYTGVVTADLSHSI